MKNNLEKILIIFCLLAMPFAYAQFRDIDDSVFETKAGDIPNENYIHKSSIETVNVLKDNNEKLYGIVSKSQVLNFDRSISRVSITDENIADVVVLSPKQVLINGKKTGATSIIFWYEGSEKPVFYNLVIQQNAESFMQAIEHIAPNENISVLFNETGVVISGKLSSTKIKEKIVNLAKAYRIDLTDLTESPAKQVLLDVRITETSKNFIRDLGLNLVAGKHLNLEDFSLGDWKASGGSGKARIVQSGNGLVLGYVKGGKLGIDFEASEAKGDIKILAEPKLLAVDGKEGSFSVGNQVPVPSEMGQYGNISYEYKDTGVILNFTPTIMEDSGRVRLELKPEISEVDNSVSVTSAQGAQVYGFKTRKVDTTVELMDGETLIIAGLLQNSYSRSRTQVPILGNIPFIGSLFSVTSDEKNDNEVVIFITPKIVDNSYQADNL